ncbi:MAG: YifB family Mg chelatase-like AAA ATPase [Porticoccaceae bacterium]
MSLALVHTRARSGIAAPAVAVEVHLSNGLPSLNIVGLPETAVKESKDRVRSALLNAHFEFPRRRITVNLAPADLPKEGGRFDLAIALGILAASGQLPVDALDGHEFLGELSLSGELRPVEGSLPAALAAAAVGRALIVAAANAEEAALARSAVVHGADHLLSVCAHLRGLAALPRQPFTPPENRSDGPDLADVIGQHQARRALEIAAAGGHNLLLSGPPGTGKTMLASRLPGILPPLAEADAIEVAAIYSVAGIARGSFHTRPFRAPHHSASAAALVGGGGTPRPGEISLAHRGVLFLDELPEFPRKVLEVLREPLESGRIAIARVQARIEFPARFQLVAAMNPCPCGYLGEMRCRCTPDQIARYRGRLSGPLLDRFDLLVTVPRMARNELTADAVAGESSATVRARVLAARQRQLDRQGELNCGLVPAALAVQCPLDATQRTLLDTAIERLGLSARAYHRLLRVARTIADLDDCDHPQTRHLTEAIGYRVGIAVSAP